MYKTVFGLFTERPSKLLYYVYQLFLAPFAICFILASPRAIHPYYKMSFWSLFALGVRFYYNYLRVPTGTSPKVHLAMALKLFEMPPEVKGVVMECGYVEGRNRRQLISGL